MFTIKLGCSYSGGVARCLSSVGCAGLIEDVADVTTHGLGADKQLSYPVTIGHRRFRVDQCRGNCTAVDRKGK